MRGPISHWATRHHMRYIMAFKASLNYIIFCLDNGVHLNLYNILLTVFKKDEIISLHGGLCLWELPYKIRESIWSLSNNFIRGLEFFSFKSILGFIFGHLHFVKIVKKGK